jgi:ubiquinone/menaquinone biosynthesis C-methylase UbiE
VGVDRSSGKLRRARERASALGLHTCGFEEADVRALPRADGSVDAVVASRVFTVVQEPDRVLAEAHRVLRPGGSCFIAEPRPGPRAHLPLHSMWLLARVLDSLAGGAPLYAEPRRATMLNAQRFGVLLGLQPWGHVHHWADAGYQYALCRKAPTGMVAC